MSYTLGSHEAEPVAYQFGASKTKNTEMVSVVFKFVGGPNDGKKITWNGYFTDKTAKRTLDSLEYCGWDGIDVAKMTGFGSKNVELVLEEEEGSDGNKYPRVQWVNKLISRGPATVYGSEQVTGLAARLAAINAERRKDNALKQGDTSFNHGANVDPNNPFGN